SNQEMKIAQTAREQAKLEVKKDQNLRDLADKRRDVEAAQRVQTRLGVSQLAVTASEARIDWVAQRERMHQVEIDLANARRDLGNARYEFEKAKLAQKQGRRPTENFQLSQFEQQVAEMQRRAQAAENELLAQREHAGLLQQRYGQLAAQYNQQRNQIPGPPPS